MSIRTGGREALEDTAPETGATTEQLHNAAVSRILERFPGTPLDEVELWIATGTLGPRSMAVTVFEAACLLVPPGYTIAPRGDVLTDEDRSALGRQVAISEFAQAMLFLHGQIDPSGDFYRQLVDALDDPILVHDWERLRAIANGGAE